MNDNKNFKRVEEEITYHPVVLFMNGTPMFPLDCASAMAAQFLDFHKVKYVFFDVSVEPSLKDELYAYTEKNVLPQLFIDKKLIGTGEELRNFFISDGLKNCNKML